MADWLIIRLADGDAASSFMVTDGAGRQIEAPRAGTLADARPYLAGRRLCAVVPGSDVLLTEADVPPRTTAAKLQQVLPFALEEQLAEDVDRLHFAPGRRAAAGARLPVAVVSRTLMTGWLARLRAAGLEPAAVYADSNLLPANPGQAVALLQEDSILLRPAAGQASTLPLAALSEALALLQPPAAATGDDAGRVGGGLLVYAPEALWKQHAAAFEAVRERFEQLSVQLLPGGPLPLLAQSVESAAAINLLQGAYAPASTTASGWQRWRTAAALLAGLVVLHGVGSAAQLFMLKKTERALDGEMSQTLQSVIPGATGSGNPRRVMESRLLSAQGADDSGGLLAMLAAVSQASAAVPGTRLQALSFRDRALELQVDGSGADALEHVSQQLRAAGWQADLTSTTANGSAYRGRIQVKSRS